MGNVLFVSNRALNSFLAESPYELPVVFQSREGSDTGYDQVNNVDVRRGFGERELPDGTTVQVGLIRYPYATMGVATLDIMSPNASYYEYNTGFLARLRRRNACASMKGLQIDPDFKARYMPAGDVFPDIIWSDPVNIDWKDTWGDWYTDPSRRSGDVPRRPSRTSGAERRVLQRRHRRSRHELGPCSSVTTEASACVEPMFRSIARYNWVRDNQLADGNLDWPDGFYGGQGQERLDVVCGNNSRTSRTYAITHNQIGGLHRAQDRRRTSRVRWVTWSSASIPTVSTTTR